MPNESQTYHIPVLLTASVDGLNISPGGVYVDVTFGGGGHSREILSRLDAGAHLYSFDQDADAEQNATTVGAGGVVLAGDKRWTFVRSNFRYLKNWMRYYGVEGVDGILADLGVSSHHFDDESRGFSFRFDSPLDMRMNNRGGATAADVVNTYSEERLADIIYLYGELKQSRRIAAAIATARKERPITTTQQLAGAVHQHIGIVGRLVAHDFSQLKNVGLDEIRLELEGFAQQVARLVDDQAAARLFDGLDEADVVDQNVDVARHG